jgi:outer membrane protein assembly factor BamB
MPVGLSQARPWFTALLVLAVAVVLFAGCTKDRTSPSQSWSGVAVEGDYVYVGSKDGRVFQVSSATGAPGASPFEVPEADAEVGDPSFYGTPLVIDGRVYVAGYHGVVYSMDANDLTDVSSFEIDSDGLAKGVAGSLVAAGRQVVLVATEDVGEGRLYVLDADSLEESCRYPQRGLDAVGQIWSTPVIVDGIAYFGDLSHRIHAVSVDDCSPVWTEPSSLGGAIIASPVVVGDKLYVGAFDRSFYEVDRISGLALPLFAGEGWFWASAVTDGKKVYAPNMDGRIYAYELDSRRIAWAEPSENLDSVLATPVIVDDVIAFGSDAGDLTFLKTANGGFEWSRSFSDKIRAPLSLVGDVVYVHDLSNTVTALDVSTKRVVWDRRLDDLN